MLVLECIGKTTTQDRRPTSSCKRPLNLMMTMMMTITMAMMMTDDDDGDYDDDGVIIAPPVVVIMVQTNRNGMEKVLRLGSISYDVVFF